MNWNMWRGNRWGYKVALVVNGFSFGFNVYVLTRKVWGNDYAATPGTVFSLSLAAVMIWMLTVLDPLAASWTRRALSDETTAAVEAETARKFLARISELQSTGMEVVIEKVPEGTTH